MSVRAVDGQIYCLGAKSSNVALKRQNILGRFGFLVPYEPAKPADHRQIKDNQRPEDGAGLIDVRRLMRQRVTDERRP